MRSGAEDIHGKVKYWEPRAEEIIRCIGKYVW